MKRILKSGMRNGSLLTLGVSALILSCGRNNRIPESLDSKIDIVGGKVVDSAVNDERRLSTVALTTDHKDSQRRQASPLLAQGHSFCSASIISRRALMTAAHCIQEFNPQTKAKGTSYILPATTDFIAFFGTKVSSDGTWLRAAKVVPHPDWSPQLTLQGNSQSPAHDIGLVILEKDIPAGYKPALIADENLSLKENKPVTLVGFGVTQSRNNNNTGLLRAVQLPLKTIDSKGQLLGVGAFMKGACAGDSGGPMYTQDEQGRWYVIGVTSVGIELLQNCIGLSNSYTDARAHKKWIQSVLQSQGLKLEEH